MKDTIIPTIDSNFMKVQTWSRIGQLKQICQFLGGLADYSFRAKNKNVIYAQAFVYSFNTSGKNVVT